MTFDKVNLDLAECFGHGQVYVALSRCRQLSGVKLRSRINRSAIETDSRVVEFAKTKTPTTLIIEEIERGKADKIYKKCREAFDSNSSDEMLKYLDEAIKVRDDMETLEFKQHIRVKLKLFHRYKEQLSNSLNKIAELEKTIEEKVLLMCTHLKESEELKQEIECLANENKRLTDTISSVQYENVSLCNDLDGKDELVSQLKIEKNQASEKINQFHSENTNLNNSISLLNNELEKKEIIIKSLNDKNTLTERLMNQQINNLQQEKANFQNEIKRIQAITWWQKLWGRK